MCCMGSARPSGSRACSEDAFKWCSAGAAIPAHKSSSQQQSASTHARTPKQCLSSTRQPPPFSTWVGGVVPPSDQRGQTHGIYQTVYQKPFQKCKQGLAFSKALATPDLRSGGRSDHPRQTRDRSSKTSQEFSQPTNPYLEIERSVDKNHRPLSNEVTSNKSRPNGTRKGILE